MKPLLYRFIIPKDSQNHTILYPLMGRCYTGSTLYKLNSIVRAASSTISLPHQTKTAHYATVFDFLVAKFPHVSAEEWLSRMAQGKVHFRNGDLIDKTTPYVEQATVVYYREVVAEPAIPFSESILYQDEHILIADKPHFLPVMPMGSFVEECLQNRLIKRTHIEDLQAVHRLDRDTAGLVMFSKNKHSRHHYHQLFASHKITKRYQALSRVTTNISQNQQWHVRNSIVRGEPSFTMRNSSSEPHNAESLIRCTEIQTDYSRFELQPITGKTHQLRLHMMHVGAPIAHDRFYPTLQPKADDDYQRPLQLLAYSLAFIDPINGAEQHFTSQQHLNLSD